MQRLYVDLKENCHGDMTGTVKLPHDGSFTFEAIAEVIRIFSTSVGIPPDEIVGDIGKFLKARDAKFEN